MNPSYLILVAGAGLSVVLFFYAAKPDYQRFQFRTRIASGFYSTRMKMRSRLTDDSLERSLQQAGLKISASTYQYLRIVITALFVVMGLWGMFTGHMLLLLFPVLYWLLLEYHKPFPMYYGFLQLQKMMSNERNRSLYLLYRLMLQEIVALADRKIGINEMMMRQVDRVPGISEYLNRCLDQWVDDPQAALKRFGDDIGTEQAKTFAHMLSQIEAGGIAVALDVFEGNHDSFRADRIAAFKTGLNSRALMATALTFIGFGVSAYDIQVIVQNYSSALMRMMGS